MNEERLFPFVGGLVVGGVGGAVLSNKSYYPMNQYYYPYGYFYPQQIVYQYPVYNTYPIAQANTTSSTAKIINEEPTPITINMARTINDMSYVPIYKEK